MSKQTSGYLVETKTGKRGVSLHSDAPVNGKIVVRLDDGSKILCEKESLKFLGFHD